MSMFIPGILVLAFTIHFFPTALTRVFGQVRRVSNKTFVLTFAMAVLVVVVALIIKWQVKGTIAIGADPVAPTSLAPK
ncbi:MAG: hypothetical protein ABSE18_03330 [Minisyncoccia bacterium]